MAKIITNNAELTKSFNNACKKYENISFVTAWATKHGISDILLKHKDKIKNSVVGLHFYQTSPKFIEDFIDINSVQYNKRMLTDVFHPKVYFFYTNENEWSAIIGSSNLTSGGFERNIECNVLMNSEEDSKNTYSSLVDFIEKCWSKSEPMGEFYEEYCSRYAEHKVKFPTLKKPLNSSVIDVTWQDYIDRMIQNEGNKGNLNSSMINGRLKLLSKAEELFVEYESLNNFPNEFPWGIAGLIKEYEGVSDWRMFGSLTANGTFHKTFNDKKGRKKISDALDIIPLRGEVTKDMYDKYISKMRKATNLNDIKAVATRFLAIKRPDYFVALNNKNSEILSMFGSKKKTLKLDEYWKLVVTPIQNSIWYLEDIQNIPENERNIFKYRVAMLDALFYTY